MHEDMNRIHRRWFAEANPYRKWQASYRVDDSEADPEEEDPYEEYASGFEDHGETDHTLSLEEEALYKEYILSLEDNEPSHSYIAPEMEAAAPGLVGDKTDTCQSRAEELDEEIFDKVFLLSQLFYREQRGERHPLRHQKPRLQCLCRSHSVFLPLLTSTIHQFSYHKQFAQQKDAFLRGFAGLQETWELWAVAAKPGLEMGDRSLCPRYVSSGRCSEWRSCPHPHGNYCEVRLLTTSFIGDVFDCHLKYLT